MFAVTANAVSFRLLLKMSDDFVEFWSGPYPFVLASRLISDKG